MSVLDDTFQLDGLLLVLSRHGVTTTNVRSFKLKCFVTRGIYTCRRCLSHCQDQNERLGEAIE